MDILEAMRGEERELRGFESASRDTQVRLCLCFPRGTQYTHIEQRLLVTETVIEPTHKASSNLGTPSDLYKTTITGEHIQRHCCYKIAATDTFQIKTGTPFPQDYQRNLRRVRYCRHRLTKEERKDN